MLISFLALIALLNAVLGLVHLSLEQIFGWVFAPIAWAMGVPGATRRRWGTCLARAWRSTSSSRTPSSAT
jgi:CNT family concentrative nucleoside transporter